MMFAKLALPILLAATSPASASGLPPDLARSLQAYDRAHYESDVDVLSRLTSADYMVLNSNISLENKAQFLADFHLQGFRIEPYARTDETNRAWGDAAVTAGVVDLHWTQDGQRHSRKLRYVDIWRRQSGRWEVTFTQVTVAQPEPGPGRD